MDSFFSKDFTGSAFELFGQGHLIALAVIAGINLSFIFWRKSATQTQRKLFRYTLAAVLLIDEAAWHLWNATTGQWTIQTMLPLHICSVFVFLSAYMLITKNYRVYEFAYFLGIGGATQALLTPDAGMYGFPHFRAFQVMISHGAIVTAAVYMTVVEGFRPTWKSLGKTILWGNVYMLAVGAINALIGSNYLFIARKPDTASLLDVLGPWPWYLLALQGIGLVIFLLLYSPFAIQDWRHKQNRLTPASS